MTLAEFPELPEEGRTVTFDRSTALAREDMAFLTWEHPMVTGAMDSVLSTELGNAAIGSLPLKGVPPGSLLLECIYTINCSAPRGLQLQRFLSLSPLRILVDARGRDLSSAMSHERLNGLVQKLERSTALAVLRRVHAQVEEQLTRGSAHAETRLDSLRAAAEERARSELGAELERLEALRRVNPQVREDEIAHLHWQRAETVAHIRRAAAHLQALRLVVTT
jgi:ATP-dependent helicase HepA